MLCGQYVRPVWLLLLLHVCNSFFPKPKKKKTACCRRLSLHEIGYCLDVGHRVQDSFGTLTQLTALELFSRLPSSALGSIAGLFPHLQQLHLEISDKNYEPAAVCLESEHLTYLKIQGIVTATVRCSPMLLHYEKPQFAGGNE